MTICHDWVNANGIGYGEAADKCVLDRFRSNEATTVVGIVSKLKMSKGKCIQHFFHRGSKLQSQLQQAVNFSEPPFSMRSF